MNEKQIAAEKAVEFIEDGMIVGLGTGSTVTYMVKKLAAKVGECMGREPMSPDEAREVMGLKK